MQPRTEVFSSTEKSQAFEFRFTEELVFLNDHLDYINGEKQISYDNKNGYVLPPGMLELSQTPNSYSELVKNTRALNLTDSINRYHINRFLLPQHLLQLRNSPTEKQAEFPLLRNFTKSELIIVLNKNLVELIANKQIPNALGIENILKILSFSKHPSKEGKKYGLHHNKAARVLFNLALERNLINDNIILAMLKIINQALLVIRSEKQNFVDEDTLQMIANSLAILYQIKDHLSKKQFEKEENKLLISKRFLKSCSRLIALIGIYFSQNRALTVGEKNDNSSQIAHAVFQLSKTFCESMDLHFYFQNDKKDVTIQIALATIASSYIHFLANSNNEDKIKADKVYQTEIVKEYEQHNYAWSKVLTNIFLLATRNLLYKYSLIDDATQAYPIYLQGYRFYQSFLSTVRNKKITSMVRVVASSMIQVITVMRNILKSSSTGVNYSEEIKELDNIVDEIFKLTYLEKKDNAYKNSLLHAYLMYLLEMGDYKFAEQLVRDISLKDFPLEKYYPNEQDKCAKNDKFVRMHNLHQANYAIAYLIIKKTIIQQLNQNKQTSIFLNCGLGIHSKAKDDAYSLESAIRNAINEINKESKLFFAKVNIDPKLGILTISFEKKELKKQLSPLPISGATTSSRSKENPWNLPSSNQPAPKNDDQLTVSVVEKIKVMGVKTVEIQKREIEENIFSTTVQQTEIDDKKKYKKDNPGINLTEDNSFVCDEQKKEDAQTKTYRLLRRDNTLSPSVEITEPPVQEKTKPAKKQSMQVTKNSMFKPNKPSQPKRSVQQHYQRQSSHVGTNYEYSVVPLFQGTYVYPQAYPPMIQPIIYDTNSLQGVPSNYSEPGVMYAYSSYPGFYPVPEMVYAVPQPYIVEPQTIYSGQPYNIQASTVMPGLTRFGIYTPHYTGYPVHYPQPQFPDQSSPFDSLNNQRRNI